MNFLIQHILPYLLLYKYITLFIISFVAAVVIPIPSGSILMAASAFGSQGYFNMWWVIALCIVANFAGDNLCYLLARNYGKQILYRIGLRRLLASKNFNVIESKFKARPGVIIFLSRFEVVSTISVNILSGLGKINYRTFLIYEVTGTIGQVLLYAGIGYSFGENWQSINAVIGKFMLVIVTIIILVVVSFGQKTFTYRHPKK